MPIKYKSSLIIMVSAIISTPSISYSATANDLNCSGCVNTKDIANNAVPIQKLARSVRTTINKLKLDIAALKKSNAQLKKLVNSQNKILQYFSETSIIDPSSGTAYPTLLISGANLQIVNGSNNTSNYNGLGNLIIGYNERRDPTSYSPHCSDGAYTTPQTCAAAGGNWDVDHRSGSHILVVGEGNNYSSFGGIVVGSKNTANRGFASISGGTQNTASGPYSSITSGRSNTVLGSGNYSTVTGGSGNIVNTTNSSISGGAANETTGSASHLHISGGALNKASGKYSVVTGGYQNNASGLASTVSGGLKRAVTSSHNWRGGGYFQNQ